MNKIKQSAKAIARQREVGARLRYIRENRGLALKWVARRLNPLVTFQTLGRWEIDGSGLTIDRVEQLAKIYHVNPAELLGYK